MQMVCGNTAALEAFHRRDDAALRLTEAANERAAEAGAEFLADMTAGRWGNTYPHLPTAINTIGHGARKRTMTCWDWAEESYFAGCGQAEIDRREMLRLIAKLADGPVGVMEHISAKASMARCVQAFEETVADAVAESLEADEGTL